MTFNHGGFGRLFRVDFDSKLSSYDLRTNKTRDLVQFPGEYKGLYYEIDIARDRDVIAVGCRIGKTIHVYDYEGEDVTETSIVTVPDLMMGDFFTCFKFLGSNQLIVVYENNKFMIYNWREKMLSKWSRDNQNNFPNDYMKRYSKIVGIMCNPGKTSQFILYTNYYYIRIHLEEIVPNRMQVIYGNTGRDRKLKQNKEEKEETKYEKIEKSKDWMFSNFQLVHRKNPILQFENLKDGRVVCLEVAFKVFADRLPGAVSGKKYGL